MKNTAGACEHCGQDIPYHRGRSLSICGYCRLNDHRGDPDTCAECKKREEQFEAMLNATEEKLNAGG